jgi:hypothetical protein
MAETDGAKSTDEQGTPQWYGWQTLAADAGALGAGLMTKGATGNSTAAVLVFGSGYAFGAPVVHLVHGSPLKAGASFALRLALPTFGGLVGSSLESCDFKCTGGVYMVSGVLIGYVAAVTLDSVVIARERVPTTARVVPTMGATRHGAWVGVALNL